MLPPYFDQDQDFTRVTHSTQTAAKLWRGKVGSWWPPPASPGDAAQIHRSGNAPQAQASQLCSKSLGEVAHRAHYELKITFIRPMGCRERVGLPQPPLWRRQKGKSIRNCLSSQWCSNASFPNLNVQFLDLAFIGRRRFFTTTLKRAGCA